MADRRSRHEVKLLGRLLLVLLVSCPDISPSGWEERGRDHITVEYARTSGLLFDGWLWNSARRIRRSKQTIYQHSSELLLYRHDRNKFFYYYYFSFLTYLTIFQELPVSAVFVCLLFFLLIFSPHCFSLSRKDERPVRMNGRGSVECCSTPFAFPLAGDTHFFSRFLTFFLPSFLINCAALCM